MRTKSAREAFILRMCMKRGKMEAVREELESLRERHRDETEQLRREVAALKRELSALQTYVADLPPVSVTVRGYAALVRSGEAHTSRAFFTHPRGYKMCIRVWPGGVMDAKNTHVSVACHIVRGEHDPELKWPFCGNVHLRLTNQRNNGRDCDHFVRYTQRTPLHISGRVAARNRDGAAAASATDTLASTETSQGNYLVRFIAHSQLNNGANGIQYLLNDTLEFIVTKIEVR